MKKSYLTLAVVAMAMASCSNEVLIDEPIKSGETTEAIGFSTFSDLATKAGSKTDLEFYHQSFAVYATKKSTVDQTVIETIFNPDDADAAVAATAVTAYNSQSDSWDYAPSRYWDKQATYNFIAVAPNNNVLKYNFASEVGEATATFKTLSPYTLNGQNLQATATKAEILKGFVGGTGKDTDLMTSANVYQAGATHDRNVNLTFRHVLSKLNVAVKKHSSLDNVVVKIKEIKITKLANAGTYSGNGTIGNWGNTTEDANYVLSYDVTADATATDAGVLPASTDGKLYFIESLVMPQAVAADNEKVTVKYSITSTANGTTLTENFIHQIDLVKAFTELLGGNNYTLTFNVQQDVITFDASAVEWVDVNKEEIIVPDNDVKE